jgi:hypothetical protein
MTNQEIEILANEVQKAFNPNLDPIDLMSLANEEGLLVAPGNYGESFSGRLEFHPEVGKFFLFYPEAENSKLIPRTRFSIAHEFGHYYLPHHNKFLRTGASHNSISGFISDNEMERQADEFASHLLIPTEVLKSKLNQNNFLTLKKILELAGELQSSATCAAIRYAKFTDEACAIVLSQNNEVKFYFPSKEAEAIGFGWLGKKSIPTNSETSLALQNPGSGVVYSGEIKSSEWFSERRKIVTLWEESFPLGYTNLALTMFVFENEGSD